MVICHRANGKNPYIKLEVSESAKAGHFNEEHNDKFGIDHYIGDEIDYDGKRFLLDENCDLQEIPGEKQPEETSEEKPEIPELPEEKPEVVPKPKPPAKTDGDPHFTMFSGRKFDFHGTFIQFAESSLYFHRCIHLDMHLAIYSSFHPCYFRRL